MTQNNDSFKESPEIVAPEKILSPEARRALAEAEERRKAQASGDRPTEYGGRGGVEPTRYGDWEKSGIAHDF